MTGPDQPERGAYALVSAVLGVEIEHRDTGATDRQGSVDAHLIYPSGRRAALEVTSLRSRPGAELEGVLARDDFAMQVEGLHRWQWCVSVGPEIRLDELRRHLPDLLRWCEREGHRDPGLLWRRAHPVLDWYRGADVDARAFANPPRHPGRVDVLPAGDGGAVGDIDDLTAWLEAELRELHCRRKITKLARSGLVEQHLFLIVDRDATPSSPFYVLCFGDGLPTAVPDLAGLAGVWLVGRYASSVLVATPEGWRRHPLGLPSAGGL